ncbi:MAG: hypothetical protein HRT71_02895 [Flavobacteriales bacterium]|nr:hypothetical protein [Flavobacteriales bacterium]
MRELFNRIFLILLQLLCLGRVATLHASSTIDSLETLLSEENAIETKMEIRMLLSDQYAQADNSKTALEHAYTAAELSNEIGDSLVIIEATSNIAYVYRITGNATKALEY